MKVLLVTHGEDIDGVGSIVLADYSNFDYDFIASISDGIDEVVLQSVMKRDTREYDKIFITDLCPSIDVLEEINKREDLKSKTIVLDHHKTPIDRGCNNYNFVNIVLEDKKINQCGTSLFYNYLVSNGLLNSNESLDEFVELTRRYDTWDWKKIYNDLNARKLHVLFEQFGRNIGDYVESVEEVIEFNDGFKFTREQEDLVLEYDKNLFFELRNILDKMNLRKLSIDGKEIVIGFVEGEYKYRNDLVDLIREEGNENKIDLIAIIAIDKDNVSLRSVNTVDVSKVAEFFGGKGQEETAGFLKSNKIFQDFIKK